MKNALKERETFLPAELLEGLEGEGVEFSQDEVVYPFISRIQSNGPQLIQSDSKYIEGAKPGQLVHTTTNELFDKVNFIPLKFQHVIIQWRNRDSGGGFVTAFSPGDPSMPRTQKIDFVDVCIDEPQSYLETNLQYICMFFDGDRPLGPAVLSCNKSQLKYAKRFNVGLANKTLTLSNNKVIKAPIFSHIYELSTVQESNAKGAWYSFSFGQGEPVSNPELLSEVIGQAKAMKELEQVFVPAEESEASTQGAITIEI